jgi:O-antigen/teichoic acid export membrane protein
MTDPTLRDLRSSVLRGIAWKAGSQILLQLSRFLVAIILARLLAPHDFGLAAMVLIFSGFVVLIADSALGTALIQKTELSDDDRSTVFWTGVGLGAACTLAGLVLSGPLASFYGEPEVRPLFMALSFSFMITSIGTTQGALLARDLNFKALELRQIGATVVGAVVGIAVAASGFGAWAIVWQQLVIGAVSTLLLWRFMSWRPSFRYSMESLRTLGSFGGKLFAQNLVYFAGRNGANVLIGRYLGAAALGTYALSYNVVLAPFNQVAGPIQQVLFPAFSRMQNDSVRMAEVWIRVTRLVGAISISSLVGLFVVAPDFVRVALGPDWAAVTPVLRILAVVGIIQSLQALNGEILMALGKVETFFWFTIVWFVGSMAGFVFGLQWGLTGVAASYAAALCVVEPLNAYLTARALRIPLWSFIRSLGGVAQAAAIMGVAIASLRYLLVTLDVAPSIRLGLCIVAGLAVYVPCCAWRAPEVRDEVLSIVRRRRGAALEPQISES